jgi:hypothetical protein
MEKVGGPGPGRVSRRRAQAMKGRTMSELHKRPEETPENWLSRLERIDPAGLSRDAQRTLALSIGYARFLARRGPDAADRGLPQPEWVVLGAG